MLPIEVHICKNLYGFLQTDKYFIYSLLKNIIKIFITNYFPDKFWENLNTKINQNWKEINISPWSSR